MLSYRSRWFRISLPLAILILMMAGTAAIALLARASTQRDAERNFSEAVTAAMDATTRDVDRTFVELRAIQGLFDASEFVTGDEFAIFTRGFVDREKGVQALEWIPRVPREERASFERQLREQTGYADYQIHPEGDGEAYFPVAYVYPLEPNLLTLGYDLASDPIRLLALETARDTGELAVTEPITLAQETETQLAFLAYAPIYSSGDIPPTVSQRRDTLEGFALAVIRFGAFLSNAIPDVVTNEIDIEVRDPDSEVVLFSSTHSTLWSSDSDLLTITRELSVANETWEVKFIGPHDYGVQGLGQALWIAVLIVGSILSFSIAGMARALFRSQQSELELSEERRRSSEAQAAVDAELARLVETANVPIIGVDMNGEINIWNQACVSTTGFSASEILGSTFMSVISEDQHSAVAAEMEKVLGGEPGYEFELQLETKDGNRVELILNSSPRRSATGEIVGAIGVGIDLTERNRLQQQLLQSDKLASIGILMSGVAHEVNNPLAGIKGRVDLLLRDNLEDSLRNDMQAIQGEVERAARIMSNLLSFAREHKPELIASDINQLVQRTVDLRAYELRLNNVELQLNLSPDLPTLMVDPHQLQQVFLNIIINAEDSMAEAHGRGVLSIETSRVGEKVLVIIADDGPGIEEAHMSKIFEPFFTTKPVGQGTGLGLSICYGIVQEHGGDITVSSDNGAGATFTIELPIEVGSDTGEIRES